MDIFSIINKITLFASTSVKNFIEFRQISKNFEDCIDNYSYNVWEKFFNLENLLYCAKIGEEKILNCNINDSGDIVPFYILIEALRNKNFNFARKFLDLGEKYDFLFIRPYFQAIAAARFGWEYLIDIHIKYNLDYKLSIYNFGNSAKLNYVDLFAETLPKKLRTKHDIENGHYLGFWKNYEKFLGDELTIKKRIAGEKHLRLIKNYNMWKKNKNGMFHYRYTFPSEEEKIYQNLENKGIIIPTEDDVKQAIIDIQNSPKKIFNYQDPKTNIQNSPKKEIFRYCTPETDSQNSTKKEIFNHCLKKRNSFFTMKRSNSNSSNETEKEFSETVDESGGGSEKKFLPVVDVSDVISDKSNNELEENENFDETKEQWWRTNSYIDDSSDDRILMSLEGDDENYEYFGVFREFFSDNLCDYKVVHALIKSENFDLIKKYLEIISKEKNFDYYDLHQNYKRHYTVDRDDDFVVYFLKHVLLTDNEEIIKYIFLNYSIIYSESIDEIGSIEFKDMNSSVETISRIAKCENSYDDLDEIDMEMKHEDLLIKYFHSMYNDIKIILKFNNKALFRKISNYLTLEMIDNYEIDDLKKLHKKTETKINFEDWLKEFK